MQKRNDSGSRKGSQPPADTTPASSASAVSPEGDVSAAMRQPSAPANAQVVTVLLAKYNEHRIQARQHETLRATMTNFMLAVAGGTLALAGNSTGIPTFQMAAGVLLTVLGLVGAALASKHYERFRYHSMLAESYDAILRDKIPESDLLTFAKLKERHRDKFPISSWFRANLLWTGLLLFVATLGIALTALARPRYCAETSLPPIAQIICK